MNEQSFCRACNSANWTFVGVLIPEYFSLRLLRTAGRMSKSYNQISKVKNFGGRP